MKEAHLRKDLAACLEIGRRLSSGLLDTVGSKDSLSRADFNLLSSTVLHLAAASGDVRLADEARSALDDARAFVDRPLVDVGREIFKLPTEEVEPLGEILFDDLVPVFADEDRAAKRSLRIATERTAPVLVLIELLAATRRIEERAAELPWIGPKKGKLKSVAGGYRQAFDNADLYVGENGVVHEVHGEIRRKYNHLGGASALGLPVTDETGTPDGRGRYNHFERNASIYWTDATGPFMLRGRVRQGWADQGWEAGGLGYPVSDQYALPPLNASVDNPQIEWCMFENGAYLSDAGAGAVAIRASLDASDLAGQIRAYLATACKTAYDQGKVDWECGFHPQVQVLGIEPWQYGFFGSAERQITIKLHGFVSVWFSPSDPEFSITLRLRIHTSSSSSFTYPTSLALCARLEFHDVAISFPMETNTIRGGIWSGIWDAFWRGGPDPSNPVVPNGSVFLTYLPTGVNQQGSGNIDVLDANLAADGSLTVFLNPLPPTTGAVRKIVADRQIQAFLGR